MSKKHSPADLTALSHKAVEQARARKARVLDEAELEEASGGVASGVALQQVLQVPIIYGLIYPGDILKQSPIRI